MERSAIDKTKIELSETALFHIFSYFSRKEQLKLLVINQWVYSLIVKLQESKKFGVAHYYTREYVDVLKLHRARQDPANQSWLRFLLDALYFARSQLLGISFGECNLAWLIKFKPGTLSRHFGPMHTKYMNSQKWENEAWFHINLAVLFEG